MLFLSAADIQRVLPMDRAMVASASAFAQLSDSKASAPLRTQMSLGADGELALVMPAHLSGSHAFGVKTLTIFPQNAGGNDNPVINGLVTFFDTETGKPLCVLDANYLTALRTGAASGVATRLMARPDAKTLALFGTGAQALCQVWAVCVARSIRSVWVYSPTPGHAETLAQRLSEFGAPIPGAIHIATSPREALAQATIVCAATSSSMPIFDDADLCPGAHINGIGSYTPTMQEIPAETVRRARIVVDQRAAAWAGAGDLIIPRDARQMDERSVVGELGDVVLGRTRGRTSLSEITFFKSVGIAVQDVATAQAAYELALMHRVGTQVEW